MFVGLNFQVFFLNENVLPSEIFHLHVMTLPYCSSLSYKRAAAKIDKFVLLKVMEILFIHSGARSNEIFDCDKY